MPNNQGLCNFDKQNKNNTSHQCQNIPGFPGM